MTNHYEILGIRENATPEEIKEAYRKRALETHPDRTGSEAKQEEFIKVNAAYQTLSNPQDRAQFDRQLRQKRRKERSGHVRFQSRNGRSGRRQRRQRRRTGVHRGHHDRRSRRRTPGHRARRMLDPLDAPPEVIKYGLAAAGVAAVGYGIFGPTLVLYTIASVIGLITVVCVADILDDLVLGGRLKDLF